MEIFKVLGICLIAAVIALVFDQYKKEYSAAVVVIAGCIIFVVILKQLIVPVSQIGDSLQRISVDSRYFLVAIKALALGYITKFVADSCRDFGQSSLASKAEFAGKAAVFTVSLPLVNELFAAVVTLLE